jgi:hypothetical protein
MKLITEFLLSKNFLFSDFKEIRPRELSSRKKIKIYSGCDIKNHFVSIFILKQKSRFIMKNFNEIQALKEKLKLLENHNFRINLLLLEGEICSQSLKMLQKDNWVVYNDFV